MNPKRQFQKQETMRAPVLRAAIAQSVPPRDPHYVHPSLASLLAAKHFFLERPEV
jgi:hypothetical protein